MKETTKKTKEKSIIRACHCCLKINESERELERCSHCNKSFLPLRYFEKVHTKSTKDYSDHYADSSELDEESLIKGLFVLW